MKEAREKRLLPGLTACERRRRRRRRKKVNVDKCSIPRSIRLQCIATATERHVWVNYANPTQNKIKHTDMTREPTNRSRAPRFLTSSYPYPDPLPLTVKAVYHPNCQMETSTLSFTKSEHGTSRAGTEASLWQNTCTYDNRIGADDDGCLCQIFSTET